MIRATNHARPIFQTTRLAAMHGDEKHGAKKVKMRITAHGFEPKGLTIQANKSVKLVIDVSAAPGCAKTLAIPSLAISKKADETGKVTITIPAQKSGKLLLQCSMAMFKAGIDVTD